MICPVCKKDMLVIEYKQIELDYCQSCHGVWFDSGELELLLESGGEKDTEQSLYDVLNLPESNIKEKKRHCPVCNRNMRKVNIGGEAGVVIDCCAQNDGLWFDGGEITSLVEILAGESKIDKETDAEIIAFLKGIFRNEQE